MLLGSRLYGATVGRLGPASRQAGAAASGGLPAPAVAASTATFCRGIAARGRAHSFAQGQRLIRSRPLASQATAAAGETAYKLVIYSKPDCPLCDKLKDKLDTLASAAQFAPNSLTGAEIEVRDITTNDDWFGRYQYEIPVMARCAPDGSGEREIPRPSPRGTAANLDRHLQKAFDKMA